MSSQNPQQFTLLPVSPEAHSLKLLKVLRHEKSRRKATKPKIDQQEQSQQPDCMVPHPGQHESQSQAPTPALTPALTPRRKKTSRPPPAVPLDTNRDRFMRLPEVRRVTGLSRSSLYRLLAESAFPKSVRLSANTVAWLASEVDTWIASRVAASRGSPSAR